MNAYEENVLRFSELTGAPVEELRLLQDYLSHRASYVYENGKLQHDRVIAASSLIDGIYISKLLLTAGLFQKEGFSKEVLDNLSDCRSYLRKKLRLNKEFSEGYSILPVLCSLYQGVEEGFPEGSLEGMVQ